MSDSSRSLNVACSTPTSQQHIIKNKKIHTKYCNQERLPSISEWFEQPSQQECFNKTNFHTTQQQIQEGSVPPLTNNNSQSSTIIRNRSISNGTNSLDSPHVNTTYPTNSNVHEQTPASHNDQSIFQQNITTKFSQHGRGKAPHSRVRSVPPVMMGNSWNNQTSNIDVTVSNNLPSVATVVHTTVNNCNQLVQSPQFFNSVNNSTTATVTFQTTPITIPKPQLTPANLTHQPSQTSSNTNEPKNEFVLVIENEASIKQYSERASLHNPNPFNPLSRRISAKEVWNSIAAATQANKMLNNSPKIKKPNKMSNSIANSNRNRCQSPTSSSSNTATNSTCFSTFTQQTSNQSFHLTPLSSITIRSRKRSNSNPLVLPFDKLTLEDSPTINNQIQPTMEQTDQTQLHLLGNEFVDFSNGEHESQRKNRGEKVFKFKMINF